MRVIRSLVAALCMIGFAMPAQAIGMQFCDDIKDDQARMACLQQHISHLEETIVVLGRHVATLENALQKMLEADASYKLKSVAQGEVPRSRRRQQRRAGLGVLRQSRFLVGVERSADQEAGKDGRARC